MSDLFSLTGKTALVTGGSQGIGAAIAAEFLRAGAQVLICARHLGPIRETVTALDELGQIQGIPADLASLSGIDSLVDQVRNITVNAVAPGVFRSQLTESVLDDPQQLEVLVRNIPLRRIGRPEQIGGTAVYLASRAGAFTTGAVLAVDGGITGCG